MQFTFRMMAMAACLLLSSSLVRAEETFKEGVHYLKLPKPVELAEVNNIEVMEVFWYGCRHCYNLSPKFNTWQEGLGKDVNYHRLPAVWHPRMKLHAQAFYTAEQLGVMDKFHPKMYDEMNVRRRPFKTEREIADLFEKIGVERATFSEVFNSLEIKGKALKAEQLTRQCLITGTPRLVVQGKYLISGRALGGNDKMMEVAEFLIEKEREQASSDMEKDVLESTAPKGS
ncbi:thiol:disulfide interchange protein DsbA/DsbL [Porticoccaceae bacterium LTM1]|nr:thiol:disulfide interchange protein DsbA/DsbL [Porticoccaceae bacterium LTM1]